LILSFEKKVAYKRKGDIYRIKTVFVDKLICVNNHPELKECDKFFLECVK